MSGVNRRLSISPKHFILEELGDTGCQLVMDRVSGICTTMSNFDPLTYGVTRDQLYYMDIFGFLGLVTIEDANFIAIATDAVQIATMRGFQIFTVIKTEFIPFEPQPNTPSDSVTRQLQGLSKLLSTGFYFSNGFDLTNCLQKQSQAAAGSLHDQADVRFYWNYEMYRDFSLQGVQSKWFTPLIQGYIGADVSFVGGVDLSLLLISRRSCYRAGTRYNARGIDDEGNVANFVESEQIVIVGDSCFSLLQIRGSVPVFWQQTGVTASLALTRSRELTTQAFLKHIESLVKHYKHVLFVNLLSSTKGPEQQLTDALQALLQSHQNQLSQLAAYVFFDFHGICQSTKFYNLKTLLLQIEEMMNYYLYFYVKGPDTICQQKGVVRVNCLDCLDRTNVVMSRIAWQSLTTQLGMIGISMTYDFDDATLTHPFVKSFKNLWADNGDMLSFAYTGTGSTISSVTRSGKQSIRGMLEHGMKSLSRFYQANVEDNSRQESIDLLLKRRADCVGGQLISKIRSEVSAREHEYSDYTKVTLQICTWNLGGRKPPTDEEMLLPWLAADTRPDVIVVALQEIVKLSALNALPGSNTSTVGQWNEVLNLALQLAPDPYLLVKTEDMFGCLILLFAKASIASNITKIEGDKIKTGFKGKLGNKGSVMVRFNIFDTSVCIWNCHLASGNDQVASRCSQLEDIERRGFQQDVVGKPKTYTVNEHNVKILTGDLNFRIALSNFDVRRLSAENNLQVLLQHDQLLMVKPRHPLLSRYSEPEIKFLPTYKYDLNTHDYDSSRKQRTPSWCDRILYSGSQITPLQYNRVELTYSDHRPVFATFEVSVKSEDTLRRSRVEFDVCSRMHGLSKDIAAPEESSAPGLRLSGDLWVLDDASPRASITDEEGGFSIK